MSPEDEYPRETVEFVSFDTVAVNGMEVTDFEVAVVRDGARPVDYTDSTTLDGTPGFMLVGPELQGIGRYRVFVRVPDNPESPVIDAGTFRLT